MTRTQTRRAGPAPCQRRGESLSSSFLFRTRNVLRIGLLGNGGSRGPSPQPLGPGSGHCRGSVRACGSPAIFAVPSGFCRLTPNLFVPSHTEADASPLVHIYLCSPDRDGWLRTPAELIRGGTNHLPHRPGSVRPQKFRPRWMAQNPCGMHPQGYHPTPKPLRGSPEGLGGKKKKKKKMLMNAGEAWYASWRRQSTLHKNARQEPNLVPMCLRPSPKSTIYLDIFKFWAGHTV